MNKKYIFATSKEWCINAFYEEFGEDSNWMLITNKDDLNLKTLMEVNPQYVFFPHWSWIVPKNIVNSYECVCFHMTDVPYGRGGSPLQNLIVRGHDSTKITALKMVEKLDAGPVYDKVELSLSGSAQEIFNRMAPLIIDLIKNIVHQNPLLKEQVGQPFLFERRTPEQSKILSNMTIEQLYDHIRMLDADGYPKSFLDFEDLHFEFSEVKKMENGKLAANVIISKRGHYES